MRQDSSQPLPKLANDCNAMGFQRKDKILKVQITVKVKAVLHPSSRKNIFSFSDRSYLNSVHQLVHCRWDCGLISRDSSSRGKTIGSNLIAKPPASVIPVKLLT